MADLGAVDAVPIDRGRRREVDLDLADQLAQPQELRAARIRAGAEPAGRPTAVLVGTVVDMAGVTRATSCPSPAFPAPPTREARPSCICSARRRATARVLGRWVREGD